MTQLLPRRVVCSNEKGLFGARSYERHIAAEDIEKLWKLVDGRPPEKCADARNPGVSSCRRRRSIAARFDFHRAEFVDIEEAAEAPDATLDEKYGAAIFQFDRERCDSQYGGCEEHCDCGEAEVDDASQASVRNVLAVHQVIRAGRPLEMCSTHHKYRRYVSGIKFRKIAAKSIL